MTDDPKRNFQEGASSLDSKKTGVHRHGRNVSEPKSFGVRYMKKTMHSWDAVKIHDAGHSIRYRNRGCAELWCGKRTVSPSRLKQAEITCKACVKAIQKEASRFKRLNLRWLKARKALEALEKERKKFLDQEWPMPQFVKRLPD